MLTRFLTLGRLSAIKHPQEPGLTEGPSAQVGPLRDHGPFPWCPRSVSAEPPSRSSRGFRNPESNRRRPSAEMIADRAPALGPGSGPGVRHPSMMCGKHGLRQAPAMENRSGCGKEEPLKHPSRVTRRSRLTSHQGSLGRGCGADRRCPSSPPWPMPSVGCERTNEVRGSSLRGQRANERSGRRSWRGTLFVCSPS